MAEVKATMEFGEFGKMLKFNDYCVTRIGRKENSYYGVFEGSPFYGTNKYGKRILYSVPLMQCKSFHHAAKITKLLQMAYDEGRRIERNYYYGY